CVAWPVRWSDWFDGRPSWRLSASEPLPQMAQKSFVHGGQALRALGWGVPAPLPPSVKRCPGRPPLPFRRRWVPRRIRKSSDHEALREGYLALWRRAIQEGLHILGCLQVPHVDPHFSTRRDEIPGPAYGNGEMHFLPDPETVVSAKDAPHAPRYGNA